MTKKLTNKTNKMSDKIEITKKTKNTTKMIDKTDMSKKDNKKDKKIKYKFNILNFLNLCVPIFFQTLAQRPMSVKT